MFARKSEDSLYSREPKTIDNILCETARHVFWDSQVSSFLKTDIIIDVNDFATVQIYQQVVEVPKQNISLNFFIDISMNGIIQQ